MKKLAFLFFLAFLSVAHAIDSDNDRVDDATDLCPRVRGVESRNGCPEIFSYGGDRFDRIADHVLKNSCLSDLVRTNGAIVASFGNGYSCPAYRMIYTAPLRRCDILFSAVIDAIDDSILSRSVPLVVEPIID